MLTNAIVKFKFKTKITSHGQFSMKSLEFVQTDTKIPSFIDNVISMVRARSFKAMKLNEIDKYDFQMLRLWYLVPSCKDVVCPVEDSHRNLFCHDKKNYFELSIYQSREPPGTRSGS